MNIIDNNGQPVSEVACIARFFRLSTETVAEFHAQVKALTPEAKHELAVGAAKELGFTVTE